jgi:hypothetical protein
MTNYGTGNLVTHHDRIHPRNLANFREFKEIWVATFQC